MNDFVAKYNDDSIRAQVQEEMANLAASREEARKQALEKQTRRKRNWEQSDIIVDIKYDYLSKIGREKLQQATQCQARPTFEFKKYMACCGSKMFGLTATCDDCGLEINRNLKVGWRILGADSDETAERKMFEKAVFCKKRLVIEGDMKHEMIHQMATCHHEDAIFFKGFVECEECGLKVSWDFDDKAYDKYIDDSLEAHSVKENKIE